MNVRTLDEQLKARTGAAADNLVQTLENRKVRCVACGHRCVILEGLDGICRVRFNRGGLLRVPRGYVGGIAVDPIEKKPFFHVLPGARAVSFGMLGCDLHCGYCQNWLTSQTLRDAGALAGPRDVQASDIVEMAERSGAPVIVSTYNEPLITAEWAMEIFRPAAEQGILCGFVSNGNATPEVLGFLRPSTSLFKVDLKGFRKDTYRQLGGRLETVLDSIRAIHDAGFWIEIVTLVVPGFNDSEEELRGIAAFLAGVDLGIPWHVTAFHGDYRMKDRRDTTMADLIRAREIGIDAGLRFVYAGNCAGRGNGCEDTFCPGCREPLVRRDGYQVLENRVEAGGRCP
ncbi:MAG: AmmeMemoRadiSam system radical SAM enzyme, partial [Acidobacteria bacterium]|nr:AmmeMemoRadiSam system radical SAM enzyme [Candidatus Polarisedimenticola svalbardensis]